MTAFAGINSSEANQQAGNNEHLRSFRLDYPPRRAQPQADGAAEEKSINTYRGNTQALGRQSLFSPSSATKKETYQRVLRVSSPGEDGISKVGAIATGLAPEGEVVIFNGSSPQKSEVLKRIRLGKSEEAADIDIWRTDEETYQVAYCTDFEVHICSVSSANTTNDPDVNFLYETSQPDAFNKTGARPKFRAVRFLTPKHLLLLQNKPGRSGAELLILNFTGTGSVGTIVLRKKLHSAMKAAIGLDVCILSASQTGDRQVVIAVAGQNTAIELLTLETTKSGLSKFKPYTILRDVHPLQMTKICFSRFTSPTLPATAETKPQYIKLASVSMGNTVVVHTLPLHPYPAGPNKTPRYVLNPPGPSEAMQTSFSVVMAVLVIGLVAFLLQAFTEIRGGVPPHLGAVEWLSPRMRDWIAKPYMFAENITAPVITSELPPVETVKRLRHYLSRRDKEERETKAIVVRDEGTELSAEVHPDREVVEKEARRWEDLHEHEKESWKQRLIDAGEWAVDEGESILKGVFFSELAGGVGQIVGDAIRGG